MKINVIDLSSEQVKAQAYKFKNIVSLHFA